MSYVRELLGLTKVTDTIETERGNIVTMSEESTSSKAIDYVTDGGDYITFQQYAQEIKQEIVDLDYINQEMVFCALIKFGIIEKRATNSYIPPSETYEKMKGKDGLVTCDYYRRKSNSLGTTFGFDLDSVNQLNNAYKLKVVTLLQELEDALDAAMEEAKEFGDYLKQKHRESDKGGKPSVHMEVRALFEVQKKKLIRQHLEC